MQHNFYIFLLICIDERNECSFSYIFATRFFFVKFFLQEKCIFNVHNSEMWTLYVCNGCKSSIKNEKHDIGF